MTANILDGKLVADKIKATITENIHLRNQTGLGSPGLAVVLIGNNPASEIYVKNKRKACEDVGIISHAYDLPSTTSEKTLLNLIDKLNVDPKIHGILIQLPLPPYIDDNKIIERISPDKDVDGFHPYNLGRLAQRFPLLRPCTPYGIIQLLEHYHIPIKGKHTVVVGASNIVGRPMALEFLLAGATVTICHRFTKNLEQHIRMADIIVAATGVCDVINPDWLSINQVVVDVGMHRLDNGKLRGDINFSEAKSKVAWLTPVPRGVGPMTIATLLQNTLTAAEHSSRD